MKKSLLVSVMALSAGLLFAKPFAVGNTLYVSAKDVKLRKTESPLSTVVTTISYGDVCTVLESNDKNSKIKMADGNSVGWISNGSLTKKKITTSTKQNARASADELAMAGKGFSAKAENAFKQSNSNLKYAEIDEIEKINISDDELSAFIKEGHLNGGEE